MVTPFDNGSELMDCDGQENVLSETLEVIKHLGQKTFTSNNAPEIIFVEDDNEGEGAMVQLASF